MLIVANNSALRTVVEFHIFIFLDNMPALNFAFHCTQPLSPEYPTLLRCPKMEQAIKVCQKNGKKVVLSIGGDVGKYGFKSDSEAELFAYRMWNLFLGGKELNSLRPFGRYSEKF